MTRREKVLAMCAGGTLGGLALVMLVRWAVLDPFQTVKDQIAAEQIRRQRLNADLRSLSRVDQEWQDLTRRTFAQDPKEAERRFREDMHQLLERHGLRDPKVSPGSPIKYKDGSTGVPLTINATGTLNQIVGFLCDFYRRDYLARLDKVRISAEQSVITNINSPRARSGSVRVGRVQGAGNPRGAGAEPGPNGPELKVNVSAVTVVLPKLADAEHPVLQEVVELPSGRLLRDLNEYNYIFDRNPFKPYQEPSAVVVAPPSQPEPGPAPPPPPPPPPPPTGRDQQFVRGTTCLNGEAVAYVIDERHRDQAPAMYRVDDKIDEDGQVVLILPGGLVVRVKKPDGDATNYFYPLGKSFKEREELNPDERPEIAAALAHEYLQ